MTIRTLLDALMEDCRKRQLTPQAWWLGREHHTQALEELRGDPAAHVDGMRILEIDGLPVKHLGRKHEAVVDGDALVHSIACASIVAKVVRDRLMHRLAVRYP
ncbi:MAG: hypothetical protein ACREI7_02575, partial [Myxococcota bacterium]